MLEFTKLGVVKAVAELVASAGAGMVVGNIIKATTPDELTRYQRVLVGIGAFTVGGVLSDLSAKYVSGQIQDTADKINAVLHPVVEESEPDAVAE